MVTFILGVASGGGGYGTAIEIFAAVITIVGGGGITAALRADRKRAGTQAVRDFQFSSLIDPKTGVTARFDKLENTVESTSREVTENTQALERHGRKLTEHIKGCEDTHTTIVNEQRKIWSAVNKKQDKTI